MWEDKCMRGEEKRKRKSEGEKREEKCWREEEWKGKKIEGI